MERKTIFERLAEDIDYKKEFERIIGLYHSGYHSEFKSFVDNNFWNWPYRDTCTSSHDLLITIGIDEHRIGFTYFSQNLFLDFCEAMYNFSLIAFCGTDDKYNYKKKAVIIAKAIQDNIIVVLNKIGYETYTFPDNRHAIIVQSNPVAAEIAEIVDEAYGIRIMEYNHYLLKGNIEGKRDILKNLADLFESKRDELNSNNLKTLAEDIGFLLNNLNIRHSNSESKLLEKLSPKELEEWYDKTYTLILSAIISLERISISKEIDVLKSFMRK